MNDVCFDDLIQSKDRKKRVGGKGQILIKRLKEGRTDWSQFLLFFVVV